MRKFTESLVTFDRNYLIEMGEDFAEDVMLKMDSYLSVETLPGRENIVRVSTHEPSSEHDLYSLKCQLFYTFKFTQTTHLFESLFADNGIRISKDFTKFTEFINRMDEFTKQISVFSTQQIIVFGKDDHGFETIYIHLGKNDVKPEDYYDIFKSRIDRALDKNGYSTSNSEFKDIGGKWVLELDIKGDLKHIDKLSDKGLIGFFTPHQKENPVAYEEYMKEPITKDIWDNFSDSKRQEAWVDRFRAFTYWDIQYDSIKTITPTKLQLINPTDDGLEEYRPNNI
jgi:hypothetical protein